jgi:uncharacterized protein (TIGR02145 family)
MRLVFLTILIITILLNNSCKRNDPEIPATEIFFGNIIDSRDGRIYITISSGNQVWMAENLNYSTSSESWCLDENDRNCERYGRLYNSSIANTVCPPGWQLPSKNDFETLINNSALWESYCKSGDCYKWWSSTIYGGGGARYCLIAGDPPIVSGNSTDIHQRLAIRCIKQPIAPCEGVTTPPGYGIIESSGRCCLDRNLGASQVATSSTDTDSYGDLFQWGRAADGHQVRTSETTTTLSDSDTPGHAYFIKVGSQATEDWRNPQNPNLWQGVNGTNNPCPPGWRIPTSNEWSTERQSWDTNSAAGAFSSPLRLPMAGVRSHYGPIGQLGAIGFYWSSTATITSTQNLNFSSYNALESGDFRARGLSVRCIKD